MTAKEKAKELFDKYFSEIRMPSDCEGCMQCIDKCENMVAIAKKYSLIAVDEILNHHYQQKGLYKIDRYYFQQVKKELEKL